LTIFGLFFFLFTVPKTILLLMADKKWPHLRNFLKGIGWNFYNSGSSVV
jgi:hypothetical protein